jgi:hypothetical protein
MASATSALNPAPPRRAPDGRLLALTPRLEHGLLWALGFSGFLVIVEPSPYDLLILLVAPVFLFAGVRLHAGALVLFAVLALFNVGGLFSLLPFLAEPDSVMFIVISVFLGCTAVFYALLVSRRPVERLEAFRRGYIWAGVAASTAGMVGYFGIGGLSEIFTRFGRASGTFKDPNVLGTFVILPLVFLAQDLLLRRGSTAMNAAKFGVILFGGVFLSFSRGAWGHAAGSVALMFTLTFCLTHDGRLRRRVVTICVLGVAALSFALSLALSVDPIAEMFKARASLSQSYDMGETGRFGNQIRSVGELLERPNGYGPLRFRYIYPEDPHNVYVNAFSSYGWLGGLSYLLLVVVTIILGWRMVGVAGPIQPYAIAIWSTFFIQILQGIQIDTDHWRHWYIMLGFTWGLAAHAARAPRAPSAPATAPGRGA